MGLLRIAHVPPAKVDADQTVLEAVGVMAKEGVGAVAVIEKGEKAELSGVFTERDLMLRVVLQKLDPEKTKVREVMTAPVTTITEDFNAEGAFKRMVDGHIRHLAIVSPDGELLGMHLKELDISILPNALEVIYNPKEQDRQANE